MFDQSIHILKMPRVLLYLDCPQLNSNARINTSPETKENKSDSLLLHERNYDFRIFCEVGETSERTAAKVKEALLLFENERTFSSTRESIDNIQVKTFTDVTNEGCPRDRGLFVPVYFLPSFSTNEWHRVASELDFISTAQVILERLINPKDIHPHDFSQIIQESYAKEHYPSEKYISLAPLDKKSGQYVVEMFHGPTGSVEDSIQMMALRILQHAVAKTPPNNK